MTKARDETIEFRETFVGYCDTAFGKKMPVYFCPDIQEGMIYMRNHEKTGKLCLKCSDTISKEALEIYEE